MRSRAVSQVQIDQALVWNTDVFRDRLEVGDRIFIKPNGDLFFQLGCVWVFPCSGEIVFFAHVTPLWIGLGFLGTGLARGDDANDITCAPIAVTDQQQTECAAQAKNYKAVFVL